ncbi:MAG: hypothetical protein RBU21_03870 [FCB group bacterium]|jgi:uncharacterized protein YjeT (DUF2065 family)|nr:hypothetical protein [FCB group bacterium]
MAVAVAWFFWTVFTVMGAIALFPSNAIKAGMGPVLMWSFCALYAFAGLVALFSPNALREAGRAILSRPSARIAGIGYMIVGAALYRVAGGTSLPLLGHVVGVIAFIKGGVQLLLPTVAITVVEWWRDLSSAYFRAAALAAFVLAGLFGYAAEPKSKPVELGDGLAAESAAGAGETRDALPAVLPPDQSAVPAEVTPTAPQPAQ